MLKNRLRCARQSFLVIKSERSIFHPVFLVNSSGDETASINYLRTCIMLWDLCEFTWEFILHSSAISPRTPREAFYEKLKFMASRLLWCRHNLFHDNVLEAISPLKDYKSQRKTLHPTDERGGGLWATRSERALEACWKKTFEQEIRDYRKEKVARKQALNSKIYRIALVAHLTFIAWLKKETRAIINS